MASLQLNDPLGLSVKRSELNFPVPVSISSRCAVESDGNPSKQNQSSNLKVPRINR